jgi:GAF domain-containing protein
LLFFLLLAIVPALGLTLSTGLEVRRRAISEAEETTLRLLRPISTDTEKAVIDGTRKLLLSLAEAPEVRSLKPRACDAILATELKQHSRFLNLGAIRQDGTLYCSARPFKEPIILKDRSYFQRAVNTRDFAAGGYEVDPITAHHTLNFAYPVSDAAGKARAVVFASLDLTRFSRLVSDAHMPAGTVFVVADHAAVILDRYPNPGRWVGYLMPEALIARRLLADKTEGAEETVGLDGVRRLYAFSALGGRIHDPDLLIGIGFPSSIAYDIALMTGRNLIGLGVVAVLAFAVAYVNANLLFLRPVNALVAATRRLGAGDTSARTGLRHSRGELGQLAHSFDAMAASLQSRQDEIEQSAEALRRYAHRLENLHELDKAILRVQPAESIAELAIRRLADIVPAQRISLAVFDVGGNKASIVADHPHGSSPWPKGARYSMEALGGLGGLFHALRQGKPLTLSPQSASLPPFLVPIAQRLGVHALHMVPLLVQGEVIGALNLWTDDAHELASEHLAIAGEAASQIAVGLESARIRDALRQHAAELEQRLTDTENVLFVLAAAVEAKGPYTEGHLRRLEKYATEISAALALPSRATTAIRRGALLHDVGKIGIPEAILNKPGPLTPEEYEIIKHHTTIGERICRRLSDGADVGPIVRGHHERWDGAGYPDGLSADAIPLGARIIAVADAWDAMTSDRPYRKALPQDEAWQTLRRGAGTQWDGKVIEALASSQARAKTQPETARP